MVKPPNLLLTLAEACTLVSERFECSPEQAQKFFKDAIKSREVSLWDYERGRVIAIESFKGFTFNWEDSTISRTVRYPTRQITEEGETEADIPWQARTTTYHARIKYKSVTDVLGGDVAPQKRPRKPPAGKPGRKPDWDWVGATRYLLELAEHPDGLPTPQAEIERRLMDWFVEYHGDHPAESSIRKFVSERLPKNYRDDDLG